jgi:hypothetical protein
MGTYNEYRLLWFGDRIVLSRAKSWQKRIWPNRQFHVVGSVPFCNWIFRSLAFAQKVNMGMTLYLQHRVFLCGGNQ